MVSFSDRQQDNILTVTITGNDDHTASADSLYHLIKTKKFHLIKITADNIFEWNSPLLVFIAGIFQAAKEQKTPLQLEQIPDGIKHLLDLMTTAKTEEKKTLPPEQDFLTRLGGWGIHIYQISLKGVLFSYNTLSGLWRFISGRAVSRPIDFLFALQECGPNAVPIVTMISFMVGLILAFVGAIQLKTFGAQIYVASLVTIGMTRIMGAIMGGIIMAGRTGSSFAATIGTMQVNEEIDALKTMGIPVNEFLVLPRLAALVICLPLLTMLADFAGIAGGAFVGILILDISAVEYWRYAWNAWNMTNFFVGVFHGFVFGFIISLCGCYYGVNCGRNADSVGVATTKAVVSSIVWMIIATGLITLICERLGI